MKLSSVRTIRKFLSIGNFDFLLTFLTFLIFLILDDQVWYFLMSWWILIFEIQCWLKSQSLTFCVLVDFSSVDQISTINPLLLRNVLNHEIRSTFCIWILETMFQINRLRIRWKVSDQSFSVKTLICGLSISEVILSDQLFENPWALKIFCEMLEKRERKFLGTTTALVQSS